MKKPTLSLISIRLLFISIIVLLNLAGCMGNKGNSINNSNSTNYGKLESQQFGTRYSIAELNQAIFYIECPGMVDHTVPACISNKANLAKEFGFEESQLTNNKLNITAANEYNITYLTQKPTPGNLNSYLPTLVSGGVIIPQGISPNKIKGVVLFYHGTEFNKNDSSPAADKIVGLGYAAIYAYAGYIVVFPDYLGYGVDENDLHPYVTFPQINVLTGINMLIATRQLLSSLNIPNLPLNLYVTGYSEGGSYALWTSYMLQNGQANLNNTNMLLKVTVPMSGAYDLANAQIPFESANVATNFEGNIYNIFDTTLAYQEKASLIPFALISYGYYNNTDCFDLMYQQFCNLEDLNIGYTLPQLFESISQPSDNDIVAYLLEQAESMPNSYTELNNSIYSFTLEPLNSGFLAACSASSLTSWSTNSPIILVDLESDSIVTNLNTRNAYNGMLQHSNPKLVNKIDINNLHFKWYNETTNSYEYIDHPTATPAYIISLKTFESFS